MIMTGEAYRERGLSDAKVIMMGGKSGRGNGRGIGDTKM